MVNLHMYVCLKTTCIFLFSWFVLSLCTFDFNTNFILKELQNKLESERTELSSRLNTLQSSLSNYLVEGTDIEKDIE